ncbi:MAG: serpin family protein [Anaerolineaceae bacterium]
MFWKLRKLIVLLLLVFMINGCQSGEMTGINGSPASSSVSTQIATIQEGNLSAKFLFSPVSRQSPIQFSDEQMDEFVQGRNLFGLTIFQNLRTVITDQNMVFSPYSIGLALAMTYGGASETTAEEMRQVLEIDKNDEEFHRAWNYLTQRFDTRVKEIQSESPDYAFQITNAVWAQQGYPFLETYLNLLSSQYGSGIFTVDFSGFPEPARLEINEWVKNQTNQRIASLIPKGAIKPLTRMVLINAFYLNAAWKHPFPIELTRAEPFYLSDHNIVDVDMMTQTLNTFYSVNDKFSMVEIPYIGEDLSMLIIMPSEQSFETFISQLDGNALTDLMNRETSGKVELKLPRFTTSSNFELRDVLTEMGMPQAFDPALADFSAMAQGHDLYLDQVIHQAMIDVDEAGTEAAAATASLMLGKGFDPSEPVKITLNRPFLFLIRDNTSGSILFLGQITNPTRSVSTN